MHTPQYSKHTSKDLVSFTRVMGGFFLILTAYLFYRNSFAVTQVHQTLGGIGIAWLLWGFVHPVSTKPLYHAWMWLAFIMNFIMTQVFEHSFLRYRPARPCFEDHR